MATLNKCIGGAVDPVVIQLNQLQNQLKEKDRELQHAHAEIKALKLNQLLQNKSLQELTSQLTKLDDKLRTNEHLVQNKNLEIKKLTSDKKEALTAQLAAEATLRRVHANQKVEDIIVPLEAVIAPLEAEIKIYKNEIAALQEDKKALERATKFKESALVETKTILNTALERALIVEELQNRNLELQRQTEICQEENTILEKANRLKVSEMKNDKVIPVKQWLEERRFFQAEMQRLKDKLGVSERTAKAESKLKEKFRLRLTTLEQGLNTSHQPGPILAFLNNAGIKKRSTSQPRGSVCTRKGCPLRQPNSGTDPVSSLKTKHVGGETMPTNSLWACKNKVFDSAGKENTSKYIGSDHATISGEAKIKSDLDAHAQNKDLADPEDLVPGFLYDRLQKEVFYLRKYCEDKDSTLITKDEEIKMLTWKLDALTKAMEIECRKLKIEAAARGKELVSTKMENGSKRNIENTIISQRTLKGLTTGIS